jgi:hypothetical protein
MAVFLGGCSHCCGGLTTGKQTPREPDALGG